MLGTLQCHAVHLSRMIARVQAGSVPKFLDYRTYGFTEADLHKAAPRTRARAPQRGRRAHPTRQSGLRQIRGRDGVRGRSERDR